MSIRRWPSGAVTSTQKHTNTLAISGLISSAAIKMPGRHVINSSLGLANLAALIAYMRSSDHFFDLSMLGTTSLLSSVIGVTLTMAIGGNEFGSSISLSKIDLNFKSSDLILEQFKN